MHERATCTHQSAHAPALHAPVQHENVAHHSKEPGTCGCQDQAAHTPAPERTPINVCIISAMPEEMAPMRELFIRRYGMSNDAHSSCAYQSGTCSTRDADPGSTCDADPALINSARADSPHSEPAYNEPAYSEQLPYPAHGGAHLELIHWAGSGSAESPHAHSCSEAAQCTHKSALLAVTGIGCAATAGCLGWIMAHYEPEALISIGSAGGLSADARVKEVVAGSAYRNSGADGTAFGYVRGQVPGQPEFFDAHMALLSAATVEALENDQIDIRTGEMLSSDSFITEENVGDMREAFPAAISADMESYAAAHVAYQWGVPFLSIRGISDLCAPAHEQSQQFHAELADVAALSARTAWATLSRAGVLA